MYKNLLFIALAFTAFSAKAQNVGIGQASPSKKLEVRSTAGGDGILLNTPNPSLFLLDNTSANTAWSIYNQGTDNGLAFRSSNDDFATNLNTRLFLEHATGNIGIGTAGPDEKLNVVGNTRISNSLFIGAAYTNKAVGAIQIKKSGVNEGITFWTETGLTTKRIWIDDANETMHLTHGAVATAGLSIDNSGSVGIGTISPSFKLDVAGTGRFTGQLTVPLAPTAAASATSKQYVDNLVGAVTETDPSWTGTANTTSTIGRTGNVGIGTSSPTSANYGTGGTVLDLRESNDSRIAQLTVAGTGQGTGYIFVGQSDTHGGGITYNGDNTPNMPQSTDHFSLFRRSGGVDVEVLHWVHNSNTAIFEGAINMSNNKVTNMAAPTAASDAATKAYVDAQVGGVTETDPTWSGSANTTASVGRTGNVGIGVAVPTTNLDIKGSTAYPINIVRTGNNGDVGIEFHDTDVNSQTGYFTFEHADSDSEGNGASFHFKTTEPTLGVIVDGEGGYYASSKLALRSNGASFFNGGNVGIGNSSPDRDLVIGSSATTADKYMKIISRGDAALEIIADDNNNGEDNNAYIYISQDGALIDGIFGFAGNNDVNPRGGAYTGILNNALMLGTLKGSDLQFGTNNTAHLTINTAGNIGIGRNNPSTKLHVNGRIRSNGINETSDRRFKKNIETLEGALAAVEQLNGVRYDWRHEEFPDHSFKLGKDLGVIAQEVEKILPEVVSTDLEGYKSVQYSHIVPVLIEAIKELSAQMKEKEASLSAKEKEMHEMKAEMHELKSEVSEIRELLEMSTKK